MDTKIYITAITLVALIFLAGGWANLPMGKGPETSDFVTGLSTRPVQASMGEKEEFNAPYQRLVYKPPKGIGAPGGRVGGGTRGQELFSLFALVPDHLGLTVNPQPTLYWYLSKPAPYPMILTINDENHDEPILETELRTTSKAGIHSASLEGFNIYLKLGTEYQWFVSLKVDREGYSKDIVAGGMIKRIVLDNELKRKLDEAKREQRTAIYSEAGLWYDAFSSISNLCESSPKGNEFCRGRKDLLDQVDLSLDLIEIAKAEENIIVPK